MTADAGAYLGYDLTDGLLCDPASEVRAFAHMILISGRAEDENGGWVRFDICPWGMDRGRRVRTEQYKRLPGTQYAPARL